MNKRRVVVNYIYSSFYQLFLIIVPLITAPYLARTLLPEAVGINSYVSSVVQIFGLLGLIGLNNYSIREIAYAREDKEKLNKVFSELFFLRWICFIITTIIYLIYACFSEYQMYFIVQLIAVFGIFVDISWLYAGLEEFKMTVMRSFIVKIINVINIFLFIHGPEDLYLFMFISSVYSVIGNLILYTGVRKRVGKITTKNLNIKRHLGPTIKLFAPQVASLVYLQCDKIMVKFLSSHVSDVGFYDQAERIVKIPLALITALSSVMLPRVANEFSKQNKENIKKYVNTAFRFSLMIALPLMFGIIAISYTMIPWFLGEGYEKVIHVMMTVSPIVLFISLSSVSGTQYLTAVNKTKILTISYIVGATLNIMANCILIPKLGPIGAACGTVVAEFTVFFIQIINIKEIIKVKEILKISIKYFISGICMLICCILVGNYFGSTILSTLLQVIIGITVYFGLLWILKDKFLLEMINRGVNIIKNKFTKKDKK